MDIFQRNRFMLALRLNNAFFWFTFIFILLLFSLMMGSIVEAKQTSIVDIPGRFETPFFPGGYKFLAGSEGNVFIYKENFARSYDEGRFWTGFEDQTAPSGPYSLAISPNYLQDKTLFAGLSFWSAEGESFRISTNGGRTWRNPIEPIIAHRINVIAVSPNFANDRTLYLVAENYSDPIALKRSKDGGETWQDVSPTTNPNVRDIIISPTFAADQTIFLSVEQGGVDSLMHSTNGGNTWSAFPLNIPPEDIGPMYQDQIAFSPDYVNDKTLFMTTHNKFLYKSEDRGQSWNKIDNIVSKVFVAPDFPTSQTLFTIDNRGTNNLRRSTDGGNSWHFVYYHIATSSENVVDIDFPPEYETQQVIYMLLPGKMNISRDGGTTWQNTSNNLQSQSSTATIEHIDKQHPLQIEDIESPLSGPHAPDFLLSPNFENDGIAFFFDEDVYGYGRLLRTLDFGDSWTEIPIGRYIRLAMSPNFSADRSLFMFKENELFKSTDLGENWTLFAENLPVSNGHFSLSPMYATDHTMFNWGRGDGVGVYRSVDDGLSWLQIIPEDIGGHVTDFDISPNYPISPTLFISVRSDGISPRGVFRSDDNGENWVPITSAANYQYHGSENKVVLSPFFHEDNTIFLVNSNGLWRLADDGVSWTQVEEELFRTYTNVVISPRYNLDHTLFAVNFHGSYISEDDGMTWTPFAGYRVGEIAYKDGLLTPFALSDFRIYRYRWPQIHTSFLCGDSKPGSSEIETVTLNLEPDDYAPIEWRIIEDADWFSANPTSGVFPATVEINIDPSTVQTNISDTFIIEADWSKNQTGRFEVPIMLDCWNTFLPIITKE